MPHKQASYRSYSLDPIETRVIVCYTDQTWQEQVIVVTPKRAWTPPMIASWAEERATTFHNGDKIEYVFFTRIVTTRHDDLDALFASEGP